MLLIIDNQSSYIKKFKRNFLSEMDFDYVVFDHNQPIILSAKTEVSGIMLSGGRGSPFEPLNLTSNFIALMNFDVPVIGFCLGHEIIAVAHRGRIKKLPDYLTKKEKIIVNHPEDPIFDGIKTRELYFTRRHHFHVSDCPLDFINLASSDITPNEIIRHKDKPIYGFQTHPEVSGTHGLQIVKNFLAMCQLDVK